MARTRVRDRYSREEYFKPTLQMWSYFGYRNCWWPLGERAGHLAGGFTAVGFVRKNGFRADYKLPSRQFVWLYSKEANKYMNWMTPKLCEARCRLYWRRFLQASIRSKLLTRSTRSTCLCLAQTSKFQQTGVQMFSIFLIWKILNKCILQEIVQFCAQCWWNFDWISRHETKEKLLRLAECLPTFSKMSWNFRNRLKYSCFYMFLWFIN